MTEPNTTDTATDTTLTLLSNVDVNVTANAVYVGKKIRDLGIEQNEWSVTLTFESRTMNVLFFQGPAIIDPPTAESVLGCLLADAGLIEYDGLDDALAGMKPTLAAKAIAEVTEQTIRLRRLLGERYQAFLDVADTLS